MTRWHFISIDDHSFYFNNSRSILDCFFSVCGESIMSQLHFLSIVEQSFDFNNSWSIRDCFLSVCGNSIIARWHFYFHCWALFLFQRFFFSIRNKVSPWHYRFITKKKKRMKNNLYRKIIVEIKKEWSAREIKCHRGIIDLWQAKKKT